MTITWSPACSSVVMAPVAAMPEAKREAGLAPFERGDVGFDRGARRVLRAGVFVALVLAQGFLHVGGGLIDRGDDGAGRRVGLLAGVDADGVEPRAGIEFHRPSVYHPAALTGLRNAR